MRLVVGWMGLFCRLIKTEAGSPSLFSAVWIIKIHKCYKIDPTPASPSLGCNIRRRIFNWNKLQWLMRPAVVKMGFLSRYDLIERRGESQGGTAHWETAAARSVMKDRLGLCRDSNQRRQPPPHGLARPLSLLFLMGSYYRNVTRGWYHGAIGTWDGGPESVVVAAKMSSIFIRAWQV